MKTRARLALERRFRQWAAGKTLRVLSAAALLGLSASAMPAEAQDGTVCDYGGTGGPSVLISINNSEPVANLSADPATGIVDLSGTFTENPDGTGASFTILGANDGFAPMAFVDTGTGVSLLVVTELFMLYNNAATDAGGPGTLRLTVRSDSALPRDCPGGTHTFAATMDGAVLADAGSVSMTAQASISDRETTIVVNRTPGDQTDRDTPSMVAGVPGTPLKPGGIFSDAVVEDSQCGDLENFNCTFRLRNEIEFTFMNPGDAIYSAGSFKSAALEEAVENLPPGTTGAGEVLKTTGVPFDRFNAAVATQTRWGTFEVGALVKLGELSDGLKVVSEPFKLRVGNFIANLPSQSFVERRLFGARFFVFDGLVDGTRFKAVITPLFGKLYSVVAAGRTTDLAAGTTLVDLAIGGDSGGGSAKVVAFPR